MFGRRARRDDAESSTSGDLRTAAIRGYAKLALAPSEKRSRIFAVKMETIARDVDESGDEARAAARLEQEVDAFAKGQREEVERTLALLDRGVRSAFGSLDLSVRSGDALAAAAAVACENLGKLESAKSYEELRQRLDKEIASLTEAIKRQAAAGREAKQALAKQAEVARERLDDAAAMGATDFLTKLPNRTGLEEFLRSADEPGRWVVARVDLDAFRPINDRYGFGAGDAVLVEIGARLEAAFKGLGIVARLEGDAFALAAKDREPHVLTRLRTVEAELTGRPVQHQGVPLRVGISFGAVELDVRSPERSLEEADRRRALYKSTKTRRVA